MSPPSQDQEDASEIASGNALNRVQSKLSTIKEGTLKQSLANANAVAETARSVAASANERAAKMEKEAAQARLELEQLRAAAASVESGVKGLVSERVGLLGQDAWNKIASSRAPSELSGGIGPCSLNPNSQELAAQLAGAFRKTNLTLMRTSFDIPIVGVVVLVDSSASEKAKSNGQHVFDTLKAAGVDAELIWREQTPMSVPFWVLVGAPRDVGATDITPSGAAIELAARFLTNEVILNGPPPMPGNVFFEE